METPTNTENTTKQRLQYYLNHFEKARQKFNEGDRFGTAFALIEAGITREEYEEFLAINPNGWYDKQTRDLLEKTILHYTKPGTMMLHREPESIIERERLHSKFLATIQDNSNSTSDNRV